MADRKIRTARKQHQCTEASWHTIKVGERYLYAACPPWDEFARGKKWWIIRACLRCAHEYGMHTSETRGQLKPGEKGYDNG